MTARPTSSRRLPPWLAELLRWVAPLLVILAARSSLADHYIVPSGSMEPTLEVGDRLVVNKLAYDLRVPFTQVSLIRFGEPVRGDVAVFPSPEGPQILVKRVVAVPGDQVEVRGGKLWLNGQVAEGEAERVNLTYGGGPELGPVTLPEGRYLVLGDNRGNSHDGRMFGLVERERFLGRVDHLMVHQGRWGWFGRP